jgi:hypothetical protein
MRDSIPRLTGGHSRKQQTKDDPRGVFAHKPIIFPETIETLVADN